ncbi:MAG: hypothetical protein ACPGQS_10060 [Bradymonadia bacterium]
MKAPTSQSKISLTALPGIAFGVEHWTEDALGVYAQGYAGIPATISNVLGNEISFTRHQIDLGIGVRGFKTLRASSSAWIAASNLRIGIEQVQEQRPAILLSRLLLAPGLKVGYETVIPSASIWLRGTLGLAYPFFVRENPADSGRPDNMFQGSAEFFACYYFSDDIGLVFSTEVLVQSFQHGGEATRAGGIENVAVDDHYLTSLLGLRFVTF